jgi:hypothetical protein
VEKKPEEKVVEEKKPEEKKPEEKKAEEKKPEEMKIDEKKSDAKVESSDFDITKEKPVLAQSSKKPSGDSGNAILITGATHARELLSMQVPLFLCLKFLHQAII